MNLPNAFTVGRIAVTPLIAWLPFAPSSALRLTAFVLFIVAAVTDYYDGHLARSRKLVTDLGRLLDPLADKLLLFGTLVPMYLLMRAVAARRRSELASRVAANVLPVPHAVWARSPLPWWIAGDRARTRGCS